MYHTCLSCGHEFDDTISIDALGPHTSCPKCESSFDVDVVGETFCINLQALYEQCDNLQYGHIVPDFDDGEMVYYDLYNDEDCLACLDGEGCVVDDIDDKTITFRNQHGDCDVLFKLTIDEASVAIF